MANKKSKFKKRVHAVHLEPALIEILKKESAAAGCLSHPNAGVSVSEIVRRMVKGRLLQMRKYLAESVNIVDWDEAI
jgi:hypothetical protein